jgi:hypothetical protein
MLRAPAVRRGTLYCPCERVLGVNMCVWATGLIGAREQTEKWAERMRRNTKNLTLNMYQVKAGPRRRVLIWMFNDIFDRLMINKKTFYTFFTITINYIKASI